MADAPLLVGAFKTTGAGDEDLHRSTVRLRVGGEHAELLRIAELCEEVAAIVGPQR